MACFRGALLCRGPEPTRGESSHCTFRVVSKHAHCEAQGFHEGLTTSSLQEYENTRLSVSGKELGFPSSTAQASKSFQEPSLFFNVAVAFRHRFLARCCCRCQQSRVGVTQQPGLSEAHRVLQG